jgi:hypothetical protein
MTKFAAALALVIAAGPAIAGHCTPPKQPPGSATHRLRAASP